MGNMITQQVLQVDMQVTNASKLMHRVNLQHKGSQVTNASFKLKCKHIKLTRFYFNTR